MLKTWGAALLSFSKNKFNWLSLFAGLSMTFAYAPFSLWWLPFLSLPIWLLSTYKSKHKVQSAYAFGLGWFTAGINWVHVSIADFGGMPLIISLLIMFLLCMYLALFPALCIYLSQKLADKLKHSNIFLWLIPALWLLTEYLRSVLLTGFPWLSLGYSQIDGPLAVIAPILGEVGLSFILILLAVAFANLLIKQQVKTSAAVILLIGAGTVVASNMSWLTPTGKTLTTALVQGNIKQELKWLPEQEWPTLLKYLELSEAQNNIDLYVWPESAIPAIEPTVQDYLSSLDDIMHKKNAALITGIINYNYEKKAFFNNLITLGNKHNNADNGHYRYGHDNRFSKHHLLPIGEFVPFGDLLRPLAPFFNLPMSSFSRGDYVQNNLIAKDIHIAPLICFEVAFPNQLLDNLTAQTELLLTVSNDAWFADSHGPHQHMEIARMRALEVGRPLVRSTNTGITAAVDHYGEFINRLPQFEEDVLVSKIQLVQGSTPYRTYGNTTIYFIVLFYLIIILLVFQKAKRKANCEYPK